jgi:hypothetical protein
MSISSCLTDIRLALRRSSLEPAELHDEKPPHRERDLCVVLRQPEERPTWQSDHVEAAGRDNRRKDTGVPTVRRRVSHLDAHGTTNR